MMTRWMPWVAMQVMGGPHIYDDPNSWMPKVAMQVMTLTAAPSLEMKF